MKKKCWKCKEREALKGKWMCAICEAEMGKDPHLILLEMAKLAMNDMGMDGEKIVNEVILKSNKGKKSLSRDN